MGTEGVLVFGTRFPWELGGCWFSERGFHGNLVLRARRGTPRGLSGVSASLSVCAFAQGSGGRFP